MKTLIVLLIITISISCQKISSDNQKMNVSTSLAKSKELKVLKKVGDIPPIGGFERVPSTNTSFGNFLRNLPIKQGNNVVYLYNGQEKTNQKAHYAVIDMEIGNADLQQCADAVIRLRAEYLFSQKRYDEIHFNFTSGDKAEFLSYANGFRPIINGNKVTWMKSAKPDTSYNCFRKYLDLVFTYAGSFSLSKELKPIQLKDIECGDIYIYGGFPGHAVIVVDVATNEKGEKSFLLAQSYMPAQEIHILNNNENDNISPWYINNSESYIYTPEWTFSISDLHRFY